MDEQSQSILFVYTDYTNCPKGRPFLRFQSDDPSLELAIGHELRKSSPAEAWGWLLKNGWMVAKEHILCNGLLKETLFQRLNV